jgi:hypothetical protein
LSANPVHASFNEMKFDETGLVKFGIASAYWKKIQGKSFLI